MEINEIYDTINNPIENPEVLVRLIDEYSKSNESNFRDRVIASKNKEYSSQEYTVDDIDEFYSTIFNVWKKSVANIKYEEYLRLAKQGVYTQDFIPFRRELIKLPDFESVAEINELLRVDEKNKTEDQNGFARTFDKYRCDYPNNPETGMIRISSTEFHANKPVVEEGPHRLYLNPESIDIYKLLTEFVKKCEENKLPYDFEYNSNSRTDMPIVIKATDDTLGEYINLLNDIMNSKEYAGMKERMKNPPIVAGTIDGWIGYGYELEEEYIKSRIDLIEQSLNEVTIDWVIKNKDMGLSTTDSSVNLLDYISSICSDEIISKMQIEGNVEEYREKIFTRVSSLMENFVTSIADNKTIAPVMVYETDYQDATLDTNIVKKVIRESAYIFSKMDPNFTKFAKDIILVNALNKNIDPNKFVFDNDYTISLFSSEEPEEIEDLDFDEELSDEPFDLEDIKYKNPLPMEEEKTKPSLADPSQVAEIIDFEDLGVETNDVKLFDNVDKKDINHKIKYEKLEDASKQEDNKLNLQPEEINNKIEWANLDEDKSKKPKKSIFKTIYEGSTEEVPEEDELSNLMNTIDKLFEEREKTSDEPKDIDSLMAGAEEVKPEIPKQGIEEDIEIPKSEIKEAPKTVLDLISNEVKEEPQEQKEDVEDIKIPEKSSSETKTEPEDSITIVDFKINFPNGNTISVADYYNNYYKQGKPSNAYVALKDGKTILAREFMQYIVLPSIGTETLENMKKM